MRLTSNNKLLTTQNNMNRNAFTFIEMIIVMAMLAVISLAIYKNIDSGVKIWQNVSRQMPTADLNILFDKFSTDLRNSFYFEGIVASGTQKSFEFATLVDSQDLGIRTVGRIRYYYDSGEKILIREVMDFSQVYRNAEGRAQRSLEKVASAKFTYYYYDKEIKEYVWLDEWTKGKLPLAVSMELELEEAGEYSRFRKTVSIPVSG